MDIDATENGAGPLCLKQIVSGMIPRMTMEQTESSREMSMVCGRGAMGPVVVPRILRSQGQKAPMKMSRNMMTRSAMLLRITLKAIIVIPVQMIQVSVALPMLLSD